MMSLKRKIKLVLGAREKTDILRKKVKNANGNRALFFFGAMS